MHSQFVYQKPVKIIWRSRQNDWREKMSEGIIVFYGTTYSSKLASSEAVTISQRFSFCVHNIK